MGGGVLLSFDSFSVVVGATGRIVQHDERREEQDAFAVDGRRASRLPSSDQPVDGRPQET
ncbi:hypothetical protein EN35_33350 [Rhodococcus qingshengii]|nr:hypothetical protein EN35_33350 [Rhodococcus qingshengii]OFE10721.1 hypothetical protein A5N83_01130 [Rhodococcus sp. 1139]